MLSKLLDTLLALKASGEETSSTDGAGTALDLGGNSGLVVAIINVTAVAGSPPSKLDLEFEASTDNVTWRTIAKAPQFRAAGQYRVPIFGAEAVDRGAFTSAGAGAAFRSFKARPRYIRKVSTVTAGSGGDGVTYSIHLAA